MENKPIVTCHGDQNLFSALRPTVTQGLPREPVEWRRSYGRPPRTINCAANFVPFNPDILPGDDDWTLLGRPFFHTYWTECDIDTYKSMVKDEIADWLASLRMNNINDWLIIVVVNDESKVKTKLLRTSVIDKVKSDFCSKQGERCVVLTEPLRMDSRSSESWGGMLTRMRQLLLQSFNKSLSRFEDYMRAQRERRTEPGWTFNSYFMLQEELAFMFEMLGLFEDALVQYDELDALFTQFVLNHAAGDSAAWLHTLSEIMCSSWDGLCLSQPINIDKRHLIKHNKASLLDFRNYLFSRQCTLLFLLLRPWEVAQRCIPFMHNCIQELDMLELKMPPGSVACWVFLSCLEVLQTCDKFADTGQMETYSLYTASLWDYARTKMHDLGVLCGLMPESETSSEQLNLVVELIAGMTQTHKEAESEPLAKLREALSSKESFEKHYMELSELAMGTYKHIGRIRSARLIGRDLAAFYMKLNQPEKAEGFLLDALKTYKSEGWDMLADKTRLDIAMCQKLLDNKHKYAKSCCHVAASQSLDRATRIVHQNEMMKIASQDSDEILFMRCKPAFSIKEVKATAAAFVLNGSCTVKLTLNSNLVEAVPAELVAISVIKARLPDPQTGQSDEDLKGQANSRSRHSSMSSIKSTDPETPQSPVANPLIFDIHPHVEMAANNKTVITTGLVSKTPQIVKRTDSGPSLLREKEAVKDVFDLSLDVKNETLKPGENLLTLTGSIPTAGKYSLHQLCVQIENIEFLRHLGSYPVSFDVNSQDPVISVKQVSEPLLAGLPQKFLVTVCAGSLEFDDSMVLSVVGSPGLEVHADMMMPDGKIMLPPVEPYDTVDITISLTAALTPEPADHIDHQITLDCDWVSESLTHPLTFKHPLNITYKLHTAGQKKYVQVVVFSSTKTEFVLSNHALLAPSKDVSFTSLNKSSQTIVVSDEQSASYVWQMTNNIPDTPTLTCTFCVHYQLADDEDMEPEICRRHIALDHYNTIYQVKTDVTPGEKADKCYAGVLCHLAMDITKLAPSLPKQTLMYEVIADPTNWAVCGKSKGVLTVVEDKHCVNLDVMPLTAGFLPLPALKLLQYQPLAVDKENVEDQGALTPGEIDTSTGLPQLVPFKIGQVYNLSAASQVHVLPTTNTSHIDVIVTPL